MRTSRSARDGPSTSSGPVLLFDGVCNLCSASVRWLIARDRRRVFRFASLQSAAAKTLLASVAPSVRGLDSVVLIDGTRVWTRSDAALEVLRRLGLPWSLARAALVLPRFARDAAYDLIARNRYAWFGLQQHCSLPTAELRERFLDGPEVPGEG